MTSRCFCQKSECLMLKKVHELHLCKNDWKQNNTASRFSDGGIGRPRGLASSDGGPVLRVRIREEQPGGFKWWLNAEGLVLLTGGE